MHFFQCEVFVDSKTDIFTAADGGFLPLPPGADILMIENERVKFPISTRHIKNEIRKN